MNRRDFGHGKSDSLSVREWLRLYTDREPPLSVELLDRPLNTTPRALLKPAVRWLRSTGGKHASH